MMNSSSQQECNVFGERVTLGDYFTDESDVTGMITIAANTKDNCKGINLVLIKENGDQEILTPFKIQNINGSQYTGGLYQYSIYSYFYSLGAQQGLQEGETFQYKITERGQILTVKIPFKTPQQNKEVSTDSIFVYGDYDANVQELGDGQENYGIQTHDYFMKQIENRNKMDFNLMLFLGDMAYDIIDEELMRGQKFFIKTTPYNGQIPQILTYGNHESGGEKENYKYRFVNDYFYMPNYEKGKNRDFQFDTQYAQFINFDPKCLWYNEDKNDQQKVINELEAQLIKASQRRKQKPWVIVFSHYPIYYTDEYGQFEPTRKVFQSTEDLLNKYKVDFYISAHIHGYERFVPLKNGKQSSWESLSKNIYENPTSPMYVVEGVAGQTHFTKTTPFKTREVMVSQDYGKSGGAHLKIYNSTHLQYQHFRTEDGKIIDDFFIVKNDINDNYSKYSYVAGLYGGFFISICMAVLIWFYIDRSQKKKLLMENISQSNQRLISV